MFALVLLKDGIEIFSLWQFNPIAGSSITSSGTIVGWFRRGWKVTGIL
jgi:hypothetical protein